MKTHDCLLCADEIECSRFSPEGKAQHARISARMREDRHRPWSTLVHRDDPSTGQRWYLDRRPIHCGFTLELQLSEIVKDEGDEFYLNAQMGLLVRFEIAWTNDIPTTYGLREMFRDGRIPMMHVFAGAARAGGRELMGVEFKRPIDKHMRFRWPEARE